jgi:hypothetical protein
MHQLLLLSSTNLDHDLPHPSISIATTFFILPNAFDPIGSRSSADRSTGISDMAMSYMQAYRGPSYSSIHHYAHA